jgi:FtsH-binding integral membrane protein
MIYYLVWIIVFLSLLYYSIKNYNKCNFRIPLTYLILGLLFVGILLSQTHIRNYQIYIKKYYFIIVIISFLFLFLTLISKSNSIIKIILFLLFVMSSALVISPIYNISLKKGIALPSIISVIIIFILLSFCAMFFPSLITYKWYNILFYSLISLIVFRIILLFTNTFPKNIVIWSSYLGLILFCFFILYDTKFMIVRAKNCKIPYDYINNILNLFLDLINILIELLSIGNIKN